MKPAAFRYVEAADEAALAAALREYGGEARILAGGQSLVPMMSFRVATPAVLIDINPVKSLSHITRRDGTISIGAMTRHAMVEDSAEIVEACPMLHQAIRCVAHRAVRNRGTVGGSLALAYPGAELPLVLAAFDADILLRSSRGERHVGAREFLRGALVTALDDDEYIASATVALPPVSARGRFLEISRRHGDFALAAAAVIVERRADGAIGYVRAAVSGGTGAPTRLAGVEQGLAADDATDLKALVHDAIGGIEVFGDHHYPEDYRRHLLSGVLIQALTEALRDAEQCHAQ
jgi:CO/xanthine dehydrogenase FAD-binding subunit